MAKITYWLPPFDPNADFVVAAWPAGQTVNGYQPARGEPFDKSSVRTRALLEELYAKRWIAVAHPVAPHVTPPPPQPELPGLRSEGRRRRRAA